MESDLGFGHAAFSLEEVPRMTVPWVWALVSLAGLCIQHLTAVDGGSVYPPNSDVKAEPNSQPCATCLPDGRAEVKRFIPGKGIVVALFLTIPDCLAVLSLPLTGPPAVVSTPFLC